MKPPYDISSALPFLLLFLFSSCEKEEIGPQYVDELGGERVITGKEALYVVNEGNFQSGNASLTRIIPSSGNVTQRVFEKWTGRSLGDVGQSFARYDGKYLLVVNNSGKIEVVSAGPDRREIGTISGMTSPRYFLGISPSKGYVTDLYADRIHIVNPRSLQVTGSIPTDGWCEAIHKSEGKVFVTNMDHGRLDVIDPAQDAIVDSLMLAEQPNSMVEDANGKLWVLCDGGFEEEKARLYRIDPQSLQVEASFEFPDITMSPKNLTLSPDRGTLYFLQEGIYRMDIQANALPQTPLITEGQGQFYNIEVAGDQEWIFVTDAKDYVQKGALYRFKSNGTPLDTFETGIIPNDIHFELQ
ncbi:MAG: DUF5074 domain-containing protein [Flavobacteriales bacterium]